MADLRCPSRLHGIVEDNFIETKCRSKFCGHEAGVVVLHRFNAKTGELIETKRFKETVRPGGNGHGSGE